MSLDSVVRHVAEEAGHKHQQAALKEATSLYLFVPC
jgi:hypothetical protein